MADDFETSGVTRPPTQPLTPEEQKAQVRAAFALDQAWEQVGKAAISTERYGHGDIAGLTSYVEANNVRMHIEPPKDGVAAPEGMTRMAVSVGDHHEIIVARTDDAHKLMGLNSVATFGFEAPASKSIAINEEAKLAASGELLTADGLMDIGEKAILEGVPLKVTTPTNGVVRLQSGDEPQSPPLRIDAEAATLIQQAPTPAPPAPALRGHALFAQHLEQGLPEVNAPVPPPPDPGAAMPPPSRVNSDLEASPTPEGIALANVQGKLMQGVMKNDAATLKVVGGLDGKEGVSAEDLIAVQKMGIKDLGALQGMADAVATLRKSGVNGAQHTDTAGAQKVEDHRTEQQLTAAKSGGLTV